VRLGEHNTQTDPDCISNDECAAKVQDINISKTVKHEKYNSLQNVHDIAIIELQRAADLSVVKTICLPTKPEQAIGSLNSAITKKMNIAGWGLTGTEGYKTSTILMKAQVPYIENEECAKLLIPAHQVVHNTYLCAGGEKQLACAGDSGQSSQF